MVLLGKSPLDLRDSLYDTKAEFNNIVVLLFIQNIHQVHVNSSSNTILGFKNSLIIHNSH